MDVWMDQGTGQPVNSGTKLLRSRTRLEDIRDYEYDHKNQIILVTPFARKVIYGEGEIMDELLMLNN